MLLIGTKTLGLCSCHN